MVADFNEILRENDTLHTSHLILRKFKEEDAEDVLKYASDPDTLKYLIWNGVHSIEEAQETVKSFSAKSGFYAIECIETHTCIGNITILPDLEHEKSRFAYALNKEYWGKGYMTEALSAILFLCFEKLNLNRVEATHFIGNEGSGKVMEKCGMLLEGVGLQEVKVKDIFRDVAHYGITRERWLMLDMLIE